MNPFIELMRKAAENEPLTRGEKVRLGKLDPNKLPIYAEAYTVLSQIFPSRTARREAADKYAEAIGITRRGLLGAVQPELKRPELQRNLANHAVDVAERQIKLLKAALSVIGHGERPEDVAEAAECSARTVYRKVQGLLTASQMDIKDLTALPMQLRSNLANDIEAKTLPPLQKVLDQRRKNAEVERELRSNRSKTD